MHEAEEVEDIVLPAADEAAKVLKPREELFDLPAAQVASEGSTILGLDPVVPLVRGDQLDVRFTQLLRERVAAAGLVAGESPGSCSMNRASRVLPMSRTSAGEALATSTATGEP